MSRTAVLLGLLVRGVDGDTLRAALHPDVVLVRADGTTAVGRASVVAHFDAADRAVSYEVLTTGDDAVVVSLRAAGVPGALVFTLAGALRDGLLVEVRATLR